MTFFSAEMRRNPYPVYAQLRAGAPVVQLPIGDLWLVLDYACVKRALTDVEAFSSAVTPPWSITAEWLIFRDPPRHTLLRSLIQRAFAPRAIASLEPRILRLARELLEPALGTGEMDLVADFAVPLPLMVIAEMIGAPVADRPHFRRWSDVIMGLSHTIAESEESERAADAFEDVTAEMRTYLAELTAARRRTPADDLLSRLVVAEVAGEHLTDDEILAFFQLLLVAGHETTTNLISNTVLCLIDHPDQRARLMANPRLWPTAIEEVLRYRAPVQTIFRTTTREVELGGKRIPPGAMVLVMVGAANRDPHQFADADRFDVGRDPNPHIAFGHGIHFCIGAALARLEARIALPELLARAPDLARASAEPWPPRDAFNVHGPTSLPVRFTPTLL